MLEDGNILKVLQFCRLGKRKWIWVRSWDRIQPDAPCAQRFGRSTFWLVPVNDSHPQLKRLPIIKWSKSLLVWEIAVYALTKKCTRLILNLYQISICGFCWCSKSDQRLELFPLSPPTFCELIRFCICEGMSAYRLDGNFLIFFCHLSSCFKIINHMSAPSIESHRCWSVW